MGRRRMVENKTAPRERGAERWELCKAILRINRIPAKSLGNHEGDCSGQRTGISFLKATEYLAKSLEVNQGAYLTGAEWRVRQILSSHLFRDSKM